MTKIVVSVRDQHLVLTKLPLIASGDIESDAIEFQFDSNWDGYTKTAIFYNSKETVYSKLIGDDGIVTIPSECMRSEGYFYFGVFGVNGELRKTSDCVRYKVEKGAITDATPAPEPTPDIYQQILEYIAQLGAAKLSINQGVEHAGKGMIVDGEGNISPMTLPTGTVVIDPTLSIPEQAADAKATGDAIADVAGDLEDVTDAVDVLKNESKKQANDIHNLKELAKGKIYTVNVDNNVAITKVVPAGAARYAELEKWGGKSVIMNQHADMTVNWNPSDKGIGVVVSNGMKLMISVAQSTYGAARVSNHINTNNYFVRFTLVDKSEGVTAVKIVPNGMSVEEYQTGEVGKTVQNIIQPRSNHITWQAVIMGSSLTQDDYAIISNVQIIDLTRMFGTGNEPTLDECKSIFASRNYPYNDGSIVSADVSGIKTVGKNRYTAEELKSAFVAGGASVVDESHIRFGAWDVDNSTFFANFMPNTQYAITLYGSNDSGGFTNTRVWYADGTWQLIPDFVDGVASLTTDSSKSVVSIGGRWNDGYTTIDVSKSSICVGTTPVPYRGATVFIPAAVRATYPLRSAGNVYDTISWDGEKWWHTKNIGSINLGTLTWTLWAPGAYPSVFWTEGVTNRMAGNKNISCAKYVLSSTTSATSLKNNEIWGGSTSSSRIYIHDDSCADGAAMKESLDGINLFYELASPVITDITDLMGGYDGTLDTEQGGSVEFVQTNSPALAVPSTVNYMIKLEEAI